MTYFFSQQDGPLLVSVPHAGLERTASIREQQTAAGDALADTDWHVDRLVDFVPEMGASLLCARYSRYVIDLNRGADDEPLYAGPTTGLVPTETFTGEPLYPGKMPDDAEISERIERFWRPYHNKLAHTLSEIRDRHGFAVLLDAHSIRSHVPRFFEGRLPDLNLGTYDGRSCEPELETMVTSFLRESSEFSHVINGRFKGGFITRHYGRPGEAIHALQLEIAQACYMDESNPRDWDEKRARPLKKLLRGLVEQLMAWRSR